MNYPQDSEGSEDSFFLDEQGSDNELLNDDSIENQAQDPSNSDNSDGEEINDDIEDENDNSDEENEKSSKKVLGDLKPLSEEAIAEYNARLKRTGVVYLSSIPPSMSWSQVMQLLGEYGEINRSHLVQEDKSITRRRKKRGGSNKPNFVEGWVEFVNKKDAKIAVAQLNGRVVGGKKSGFFHDFIWNMKYLHGFKWSQLMELMDYEKRVRQDKLKVEFSRSRKEDERYLENAAKSQRIKKMEEKRKEKAMKKKMEGEKKEKEEKKEKKEKK